MGKSPPVMMAITVMASADRPMDARRGERAK